MAAERGTGGAKPRIVKPPTPKIQSKDLKKSRPRAYDFGSPSGQSPYPEVVNPVSMGSLASLLPQTFMAGLRPAAQSWLGGINVVRGGLGGPAGWADPWRKQVAVEQHLYDVNMVDPDTIPHEGLGHFLDPMFTTREGQRLPYQPYVSQGLTSYWANKARAGYPGIDDPGKEREWYAQVLEEADFNPARLPYETRHHYSHAFTPEALGLPPAWRYMSAYR